MRDFEPNITRTCCLSRNFLSTEVYMVVKITRFGNKLDAFFSKLYQIFACVSETSFKIEPGTGTGTGMVVRVPGNSFPFPLQL